jgi:hypothetical protein
MSIGALFEKLMLINNEILFNLHKIKFFFVVHKISGVPVVYQSFVKIIFYKFVK